MVISIFYFRIFYTTRMFKFYKPKDRCVTDPVLTNSSQRNKDLQAVKHNVFEIKNIIQRGQVKTYSTGAVCKLQIKIVCVL